MKILAAVSPGEIRVAAWDGTLRDYALWRPGLPDGVGDLHRGRLTARMPALAGSFVALAAADGFLPDSKAGPTPLGEGATIGVRITRAAQGGKGPRLTARLTAQEQALIGAGPPALLNRGPGGVERLAALYPQAPVLTDDPGLAALLAASLPGRIHSERSRQVFDDAIEAAIDALAQTQLTLPGGAAMSVHPTPALTAIDIDLGGLSGERRGKTASQEAANRALLPALARQIRLRNLGGAILVDLAGLSPKRRAALGPALAEALAADPLRPRLLGFTGLGLAEILRPRVHPPLHELLASPHGAGLAALRRAAAEVAATPSRSLALRAAPAVADALLADPVALPEFAARAGRKLKLTTDHGLPPLGWQLEEC